MGFHVINRCDGLVMEFWAHIYNNHPVIEWELVATFSDYLVPDVKLDIDLLEVSFGEFTLIEDAVPLGASANGVYNQDTDTFTSILISNPTYLGHGQSTPVYKGAILCLDSSLTYLQAISDSNIVSSPYFQVNIARIDGAVLAGRTHWDGAWLAFQESISKQNGDNAALDIMFNDQFYMMQSQQDLFAQRKLGLWKNAGSTGAQIDFGSQKGVQA